MFDTIISVLDSPLRPVIVLLCGVMLAKVVEFIFKTSIRYPDRATEARLTAVYGGLVRLADRIAMTFFFASPLLYLHPKVSSYDWWPLCLGIGLMFVSLVVVLLIGASRLQRPKREAFRAYGLVHHIPLPVLLCVFSLGAVCLVGGIWGWLRL